MTCFTPDNTEGYDAAALATLNATYERRLAVLRSQGVEVDDDDDICMKSLRDHVAEQVLFDFDQGSRA